MKNRSMYSKMYPEKIFLGLPRKHYYYSNVFPENLKTFFCKASKYVNVRFSPGQIELG